MKTINSLREIISLVRSSDSPVYVRWSTNPAADMRSGRSYNHQTGAAEAGLSVNNLLYAGIATEDDDIALMLLEYRHVSIGQSGARAWLLTGDIAGRGSDNEPLLTNVAPLATVGSQAIAEADEVWDTVHGFRIDAAGRVVDEHGRAYIVCDSVRQQAVANTERLARLAK